MSPDTHPGPAFAAPETPSPGHPARAPQRSGLWISLVIILVVGGPLAGIAILLGVPADPPVRSALLSDGTDACFPSGSWVELTRDDPRLREIRVDGEVLLRVPPGGGTLTVRSPLLRLTLHGEAVFVIQNRAGEDGAQAEMLRGELTAQRRYVSGNPEVYTLERGQVLVLNRAIDLAEVEATRVDDVPRWTRRCALPETDRALRGALLPAASPLRREASAGRGDFGRAEAHRPER